MQRCHLEEANGVGVVGMQLLKLQFWIHDSGLEVMKLIYEAAVGNAKQLWYGKGADREILCVWEHHYGVSMTFSTRSCSC